MSYSIKDFLLDETFQKWVLKQGSSIDAHWERKENIPKDNIELAEEAKSVLQRIRMALENEVEDDMEDVWTRIENSI
jgi:hypothetical protein